MEQSGQDLLGLLRAKMPLMTRVQGGMVAFRYEECVIVIMSTGVANPRIRLLRVRGRQRGPFKKERIWEVFADNSIRDEKGGEISEEDFIWLSSAFEALEKPAASLPTETLALKVICTA